MTAEPAVSVVIAARNEAPVIAACIASLRAQDVPPGTLEILVVDDASTDATVAVATALGARCLKLARSGPALARNRGALAARAPLVAFVDADAVPAPDWASQLLAAFAACDAPNLAAIGGSQQGHPDDGPFARNVDRFLRAVGFVADYSRERKEPTEVGHNASCNSAYRRDVFLEAGGFRPGMFPSEDVDIDKRLWAAGYTVRHAPDIRVAHRRPGTPRAWQRMLASYGKSQADCVAIHGLFRPLHALPFAWLVGLAALAFFPKTLLSCGAALALAICLYWQRRYGLPVATGLYFLGTTALIYPMAFLNRLAARALGSKGPVGGKRLPPLSPDPTNHQGSQGSFSTSARAS